MRQNICILFGQKIREMRIERGISQEELADLSGLHRTYISDVELGKRNISLENIFRIAKSLNVKLSDLFMEVDI